MKKIIIGIVCIISVFIVSGCGKENEYERKMWGTWRYESERWNTTYTYDIKNDGTFELFRHGLAKYENFKGTYKIKDNIITLTTEDEQVKVFEYDEGDDVMYDLDDGVRTEKYERNTTENKIN